MKNLIALISLITLLPYSYSQSAYSGGEGDGYAQTSVNVGQTSLVGKEVWPTIRMFPNPIYVEQVVQIEGIPASEIPFEIEVINVAGQRFQQFSLQPGQTECAFQIGNIPSGWYLVNVKQEQKIGVFQLIVSKRPQ